MEYTEDNLLDLEIKDTNKEKLSERIKQKIGQHKLITTIILSFLILATINTIMIYNFFKILQNI